MVRSRVDGDAKSDFRHVNVIPGFVRRRRMGKLGEKAERREGEREGEAAA